MTSLKSCHFIPSNHNCGLIASSVGRAMPGAMPASSNPIRVKMDIKPTKKEEGLALTIKNYPSSVRQLIHF